MPKRKLKKWPRCPAVAVPVAVVTTVVPAVAIGIGVIVVRRAVESAVRNRPVKLVLREGAVPMLPVAKTAVVTPAPDRARRNS
jgi:hypothetical protein